MKILHIRYNIILCKYITMAVVYVQNVVKPVVIYRLTYISLLMVKIERNTSEVLCE
jgi:hypothetical protein